MATQVFFRTGSPHIHLGTNRARLSGANTFWADFSLRTARGGSASSAGLIDTVTGPTNGIEPQSGGTYQAYISHPLAAAVTISGTITLNLWASESSMSANAAINCVIERMDKNGDVVSEIAKTTRTTELGTSAAAANFTVTPTSTNMEKGDRFRIRVFADDAGTMAAGFGVTFRHDGATGGADGDSYVTFNETFSFETAFPSAATTLYLTDTVGPAEGSNDEREMWTSRGGGVTTATRSTAAGPTAPLQFQRSGTAVEWFTRALSAVTIQGIITAKIRLAASNTRTAAARFEIAVGSGGTYTVQRAGTIIHASSWDATDNSATDVDGALKTTEQLVVGVLAGPDITVTAGQRIRFRVYIDDMGQLAMVTGRTATLYYAGTTGGASGDSYIEFPTALSESNPDATATPGVISRSFTLPAPTLSAGATPTPAVISDTASPLAPTPGAGATPTPSAMSTPATPLAVTATGVRNVTVESVVANTSGTPLTPTVGAGQTASPDAEAVSATPLAPSVTAGSTLTPAVEALTASPLAPTTSAGATTEPTVQLLSATPLAPSAGAAAVAEPATASIVVSQGAPSVAAGSTTAPAVSALVASLLAPSLSAGSTPLPSLLTAALTVPAATVGAGATISAGVLAAPAALFLPALSAGQTASPAVLLSTAHPQAVDVAAGSTLSPAVILITGTPLAPTPSAGALVDVATIVAVIAMPAVTASGESNATPQPSVIATSLALGAVGLSAGSTASPATITALITLGATALSVGSTPAPATILAVVTMPAVAATGSGSATTQPDTIVTTAVTLATILSASSSVAPDTLVVVSTLPAPLAGAAAQVSPDMLATAVTMDQAVLSAGATALVSTILGVFVLPAVSASGGGSTDGTATPGVILGAFLLPAVYAHEAFFVLLDPARIFTGADYEVFTQADAPALASRPY